jgi:poly-gamma-glutamate synthesis protein (capsule biosynthesis protein)
MSRLAPVLALLLVACRDEPPPAPAAVSVPASAADAASVPATVSASAAASASASAPVRRTVTISAIGDCTLGGDFFDPNAPTPFDLTLAAHGNDLRYPFSGVVHLLRDDDLTIANLEGPLTSYKRPIAEGKFHFRGKPEYASILALGSVEVANLANNHTGDFGARGYQDTLQALADAGVGASGNGLVDERTIRGVLVQNLGFAGIRATPEDVTRDVGAARQKGGLVIVSFHWGIEGTHEVIDVQRNLGRIAIDAGADVVLGSHPHVLQAIETYGGRHIVHSLGNFVFGGNTNPPELDSIIYRETFIERDGRMVPLESRILPVRISTAPPGNDFRPVPLDGDDEERVLRRLKDEGERLSRVPLRPLPRR